MRRKLLPQKLGEGNLQQHYAITIIVDSILLAFGEDKYAVIFPVIRPFILMKVAWIKEFYLVYFMGGADSKYKSILLAWLESTPGNKLELKGASNFYVFIIWFLFSYYLAYVCHIVSLHLYGVFMLFIW